MGHVGACIVRVAPGICEIEMDYRPGFSQQHGFFHAGTTGAIADSACGYAAFTRMEASSSVLMVKYKLNLIAPAHGEKLIARASVIRAGRTLKICSSEVLVVKEGVETACAVSLSTIMEVRGRPDAPEAS